jgi:hypothetical protein
MAYPESASLSPIELLERAEAFWTYHNASPTKPRFFLLCHAIRLALRAYIASRRSLPEEELKKTFGRDLAKLLDEAGRLGLTIIPSTESEIERSTVARIEYFARYPKRNCKPLL